MSVGYLILLKRYKRKFLFITGNENEFFEVNFNIVQLFKKLLQILHMLHALFRLGSLREMIRISFIFLLQELIHAYYFLRDLIMWSAFNYWKENETDGYLRAVSEHGCYWKLLAQHLQFENTQKSM